MIETTDLRVGNWVEHNEKWCYRREGNEENIFRFQWDDSDWARLAECLIFLEDVSPIPLTTEILEKCGFEEGAINLTDTPNLESDNQKSFLNYDFMEKEVGIYITARKKGHEHCEYWIKCGYLHQLQNLYYALTGQELKVMI